MAELPLLAFACPGCQAPLQQTAPDEMSCPRDGLRFPRSAGIWRMLAPEREALYSSFTRDYETIRRAEGRGSGDAAYYCSLPYQDLSGRMSGDWQIRAASFDAFLQRIVQPVELRAGHPLTILDLGAGNGWLSHRLARRGHLVAAVDLMTNDFDGLGCYRYYDTPFTPVQAEFDHLPFADRAADLVVFNASLHYSLNYAGSLGEAARVLKQAGKLVVLDTPVYHDPASGARMVQEREDHFVKQFGFASNALASENYLTDQRLAELAAALNLRWQAITPFYGVRWLLRPLKARFLGQREPARFQLIVFDQGE